MEFSRIIEKKLRQLNTFSETSWTKWRGRGCFRLVLIPLIESDFYFYLFSADILSINLVTKISLWCLSRPRSSRSVSLTFIDLKFFDLLILYPFQGAVHCIFCWIRNYSDKNVLVISTRWYFSFSWVIMYFSIFNEDQILERRKNYLYSV